MLIEEVEASSACSRVVHGLGRPTGWVGLGRGSETFPKILKLLTAEVIPDNLVMINTDK